MQGKHDSPLFAKVLGTAQVWARTLIKGHLDKHSRLALFRTCKDAYQAILIESRSATFSLNLDESKTQQDMDAPIRRTAEVKRAITLRAGRGHAGPADVLHLHVDLKTAPDLPVVFLDLTTTSIWQAITVLHLLGRSAAGITMLRVKFNKETVTAAALTLMGKACPHLGLLTLLGANIQSLPDIKVFPNLDTLTLRDSLDNATSLQPYLPQLMVLVLESVNSCACLREAMQALPDTAINHKLVELYLTAPDGSNLPNMLDDALLGKLLHHFPTITTLRVPSVKLESDEWAQRQTQLQSLIVDKTITLSSLPRLPSPVSGRPLMLNSHVLIADVETPEQAAAVLRTAGRFTGFVKNWIRVQPSDDHQSTLALRAAIDFIRKCDNSAGNLMFRLQWPLTAADLDELRHLPPWRRMLVVPMNFNGQPDVVYRRLLRTLPPTYQYIELYIPSNAWKLTTQANITSMVLNAPLHHTQENPLRVKLMAKPDKAERLCQHIQQAIAATQEPSHYQGVVVEWGV